ncbi:MAG: DsbA family protein [Candidatus Caldarchaeum sp.]
MSKEPKMSKRQMLREKRRKEQQRNRLIAIGLIALGALLTVFFVVYPNISAAQSVVVPTPFPRPMADRNTMGDPNAPIKIVEYSDFQCPYCRRFAEETEPLLVETYIKAGKVYFVYRSMGNFISDNIARARGVVNTESRDSAMAAYCAADQGKFWEYHDALFANQTGEGVGAYSEARLKAIAQKLGLDMDAFNKCFSSGKYRDQVQQDYNDGTAAGLTGTPYFVITYSVNGVTKTETIEGAQPFSVFQQKIEAILQEIRQ